MVPYLWPQNQIISVRPSAQHGRIALAGSFNHNGKGSPHQALVAFKADLVLQCHETIQPFVFHSVRDLRPKTSCRRSFARGIDKGKGIIIFNGTKKVLGFFKIFFRLARKSYNEVCRDDSVRHTAADSFYKL